MSSSSTKEKEQQVIDILSQVNELVADAEAVFYDIAGEDLEQWDEIRTLIWSIKATLDIIAESHEQERRYH